VDEHGQTFYRTGVGLISYTLHSRPMDQPAYSWLAAAAAGPDRSTSTLS
jgi:hypothetical protein